MNKPSKTTAARKVPVHFSGDSVHHVNLAQTIYDVARLGLMPDAHTLVNGADCAALMKHLNAIFGEDVVCAVGGISESTLEDMAREADQWV